MDTNLIHVSKKSPRLTVTFTTGRGSIGEQALTQEELDEFLRILKKMQGYNSDILSVDAAARYRGYLGEIKMGKDPMNTLERIEVTIPLAKDNWR